jgi:hypothetical protein
VARRIRVAAQDVDETSSKPAHHERSGMLRATVIVAGILRNSIGEAESTPLLHC